MTAKGSIPPGVLRGVLGSLALLGVIGVLRMPPASAAEESVQQAHSQQAVDGPMVAFNSYDNDRLFVVGLDGGVPRRVTDDEVRESDADWSPDGELLAFSRASDIAVVRPDGTDLRVVVDTGGFDREPDWSPDGEQIVFASDDGVHVVARDGSGLRRLSDSSDDIGPVWSPDGRRIAFERYLSVDFDVVESDVYVVDVATGAVRQLTADGNSGAPDWSPDGGLLSFFQDGDLVVTGPDGTGRRVVAEGAGVGTWSPDGTRLAFVDSGRPAVVDVDGSGRRLLGDGVDGVGPIVWSPDGRSIVFHDFRGGSSGGGVTGDPPVTDLVLAGVDDGSTRRLTDSGTSLYPAVSPGPPFVQRLAGGDRVSTAVQVSRAAFPDPQACPDPDGCGAPAAVVVARADAYADALAAGPLAADLAGPLLLTPPARLPGEVNTEARRLAELGVRRAVVIGDAEAVSPRAQQQLVDLGLEVERVAGSDRFATAAAIAARLDATGVYLVEGVDPDPGRGWPDAIAVSGLAARQRRPLLLATTDSLPEATARALDELGVAQATIVGGTGAVSEAVQAQVAARVERVDRLAGADRYATSALVADAALADGADPSNVVLASGADWPDGLTASTLVANAGVLLLTDPVNLNASPPTGAWLADHAATVDRLTGVGGPAAISPVVANQARVTVAASR